MNGSSIDMPALRAAVSRLPDNGLAAIREAALARLDERGLPTTRDEDWKYTDLAAAISISNRWLTASGPVAAVNRPAIDAITQSIDAHWIVIANGHVDDSRCGVVEGLSIGRFSDSAAPDVPDRPLADLNAALLSDGLRIRITSTLHKPVGILFYDEVQNAAVSSTNVEIDVAPTCEAEFFEYHASDGDGEHYANNVVTMTTGEATDVRFVRIQNRAQSHLQTARWSVALGKDARFELFSADLGGRLIRNDIDIDIAATGTDAVFNGLYLAGPEQHIDNHTRIDHRIGPAKSSQEYRGILNGRCRCVWNGKAIVHDGADGTDARQANHNLLLSANAEIDAKPELEIYTDDVKCSHGTTVGQLDERALFYLRSRGIDKHSAIQMLTHAFAAHLVDGVPVDAARKFVSSLVERRLAELIGDNTA